MMHAMGIRPVNYLEGLRSDPRRVITELEKVIGRLPNSQKYDFVENQARTFGDLTELLLKRAPNAIRMQITGLLEHTYVSPYTHYLLPIRELGDFESINVTWQEIHFNPGIAAQTEVLGVPRYFTHQKARRGARAVRRGAAIKIEAGFFMTPEGREEFALQVRQIATVVAETQEYDVVMTLLQTPMRNEMHANMMNGPYNSIYGASPAMTFEDRLKLYRDMTALVNKTPDSRGFSALVTNLRTIIKREGIDPDAMVCPPYMLGFYFHTKPDLWEYSSAGPAVTGNRAMAQEIGGNGAFRSLTYQGLRLVDTHVYRPVKGARTSACDLLTVPIQIGEYYPMEINRVYRDLKSFGKYSGSSRDMLIFNEDQSRFTPVYFSDAIANSFRFNNDNLSAEYHENVMGNGQDMFCRKDGQQYRLVDTWGQMQAKYLPTAAVERVVKSFIANVITDEHAKDLEQKPAAADSKALKAIKSAFSNAGARVDAIYKLVVDDGEVVGVQILQDCDPKTVGETADTSPLFNASRTVMERLIAGIFLDSPVTLSNIIKLHETDIFVPVDIILARPWMTYNASSAIVMKAGSETGETIIGQRDFAMSSNTQDKTIEGSFTFYGKAIVKNSKNVVVAPHVFLQSYISGNNVQFVTKDLLQKISEQGGVYEADESLIAMMVPFGSSTSKRSWIDYRGTNANVPAGEGLMHESAAYYNGIFAIDDTDVYNPMDTFIDYEEQTYPANTICWQGHSETGVDFSIVSHNQGHLGPNTYAQVNNSRKEGMFTPVQQQTVQFKSVKPGSML